MKALTDRQLVDMFENTIDEIYGNCEVGGHTYKPSHILKMCDRVRYNDMFNDFLNDEVGEGNLEYDSNKDTYYSDHPLYW